jgi:hypothetical protein
MTALRVAVLRILKIHGLDLKKVTGGQAKREKNLARLSRLRVLSMLFLLKSQSKTYLVRQAS